MSTIVQMMTQDANWTKWLAANGAASEGCVSIDGCVSIPGGLFTRE